MNTTKFSMAVIIGLLLLGQQLLAQNNQVNMFIKYDFEHIADSSKRTEPITRSVYLYIADENSYYAMAPMEKSQPQGAFHMSMDAVDQSDALVNLYTPFAAGEAPCLVAMLGRLYKVQPNKGYKIDWTITDEKKDIGGYTCHKATGQFGGRNYVAWFTEEIPFPVGPWKLHGLPGAILEAADSTNEVRFRYAGLDKVTDRITLMDIDKLPELPYEKYRKALENSKSNKLGAMMAQMPPGAVVKFKTQDGREISREQAEALMKEKGKDKQQFQLNNPVERTIN
ncbi:GLPGLI family protein [Sphingobacterium thalpophilum]|uniref:GLPGLI family protein n=1 Tax=Sphingobacterium thalpophilum TaxID=259 RepID=A0A4U9VVN4_9SPHI|nr:GLPGLI family protein [Sphingobacterium thalpophilum]VTR51586.1 GLPGLI family protein [Sphingobacterium thalpophilum]